MHVLVTCKYYHDRIKTEKSGDTVFPSNTLWKLYIAKETRGLVQPVIQPNAAFHHNAFDTICFDWPAGLRDTFERLSVDTRKHEPTDGRRINPINPIL